MRGTLEERFWAKVKQGDLFACWTWLGSCSGDGYPQIRDHGSRRMLNACRVLWELTHGPIPAGLHVLHSCDNTQCVSPHHLHLGTNADNQREKAERNRMKGIAANLGQRIRSFVHKADPRWREKLAALQNRSAEA